MVKQLFLRRLLHKSSSFYLEQREQLSLNLQRTGLHLHMVTGKHTKNVTFRHVLHLNLWIAMPLYAWQ